MNSQSKSLVAACSCLLGLGLSAALAGTYLKFSTTGHLIDVLAVVPYAGAIAGATSLIDGSRLRSVGLGGALALLFAGVSLWAIGQHSTVVDVYFSVLKQGAVLAVALTFGILASAVVGIFRRSAS